MANYLAVAEALRLAEKQTSLLRQVVKARAEKEATAAKPDAASSEESEAVPERK